MKQTVETVKLTAIRGRIVGMSTQTEWGAFRKGRLDETPMENFTFTSSEAAEKYIAQFSSGSSWFEVRIREVTEWKAPSEP